MNWLEILDWSEEQLNDLRFVGYSYLRQGKYDVAKTIFSALEFLDSNNAYDLQTLGALHLSEGKNIEALSYLDRSLKIDRHNFNALLNRAKVLFALGYQKQAIAQTEILTQCRDKIIANQAKALLLGHSG